MRYLVLIGRIFYSAIFLMTFGHFSSQAVGFAAQQGVPLAGSLSLSPGSSQCSGA